MFPSLITLIYFFVMHEKPSRIARLFYFKNKPTNPLLFQLLFVPLVYNTRASDQHHWKSRLQPALDLK
jgi:hypothetical protein